jgi:hypothetical protein
MEMITGQSEIQYNIYFFILLLSHTILLILLTMYNIKFWAACFIHLRSSSGPAAVDRFVILKQSYLWLAIVENYMVQE